MSNFFKEIDMFVGIAQIIRIIFVNIKFIDTFEEKNFNFYDEKNDFEFFYPRLGSKKLRFFAFMVEIVIT